MSKKNSKRIIAVIAAIGMLGAGGYTRYLVDNKNIITIGTKKTTANKTTTNIKKINSVSWKPDYVYLQKMCTYLPSYSEKNKISEDELTDIYIKAFKYFCMRYSETDPNDDSKVGLSNEEYNYEERNIIPADQFVRKEKMDDTTEKWIFKGSALDKFNSIADIKFNPDKIKSDEVKYDRKKDEYVVTMSETLKNTIECYSIKTNFNEDGSINIDVEKDNKKQDGVNKVTRKNVEIVSAKNKYGYKIKQIKKGYPIVEENLDRISEQIEYSSDHINELLYYIKNYQYKESDEKQIIQELAYEGGKYGGFRPKALIRSEETEQNDEEYWVNVEGIDVASELLGIPEEKRDICLSNDKLELNREKCKIKCNVLNEYSEQTYKQLHFLGSQKDKKNNCVICDYVTVREERGEADYFNKIEVKIKPEKNIWGYRIDSIKTEEWDDEYSQELKQLEKKAFEVGIENVSVEELEVNNEEEKRTKAESECWISEREKIIKVIGEKYPDKKKAIEKKEKKWWDSTEKKINENNKIDSNDSEEKKKEKNNSAIYMKGSYSRDRVYYLIGNYLTAKIN